MVVKGCFSQPKIFKIIFSFLGQKIAFKNIYYTLEDFSKFNQPFKSTVLRVNSESQNSLFHLWVSRSPAWRSNFHLHNTCTLCQDAFSLSVRTLVTLSNFFSDKWKRELGVENIAMLLWRPSLQCGREGTGCSCRRSAGMRPRVLDECVTKMVINIVTRMKQSQFHRRV